MDRPEKLAENYLIQQGYNPIYEPNGEKTSPDFEINKSTAVEVRRLNENYFKKAKPEGLRTVSQPILDGIESVFSKHQKENPKRNYWVSLHIKRPVEKTKTIKKKVDNELSKLSAKGAIPESFIEVSPSITLRLTPKSEIENQIFHLGSMLDLDSGGFVLSNLLQNMIFCIEQKTNIISSCPRKYEKWWLILIDEISYGLKDNDKKYVSNQIVNHDATWEKIITLSTLNGKEILTI